MECCKVYFTRWSARTAPPCDIVHFNPSIWTCSKLIFPHQWRKVNLTKLQAMLKSLLYVVVRSDWPPDWIKHTLWSAQTDPPCDMVRYPSTWKCSMLIRKNWMPLIILYYLEFVDIVLVNYYYDYYVCVYNSVMT